MSTKSVSIFYVFFFASIALAQNFSTTSYRDTTIPFIEMDPSHYDFVYPIHSDILDSSGFTPPTDGRYLQATYGHRYLSSTSAKSDNHGGFDYWRQHISNGVQYDENNLISIRCMCDGYISDIINGPDSLMELLGTGRSVQVTCDSVYQSFGDHIKINYRHLSALGTSASIADTLTSGTVQISKGDTIGIMGESGTTSNIHLHMSTNTIHPINGNAFVHTARLFDPTLSPWILAPLQNASVQLIHDWSDSALFRVIWPYNQTINQFEFSNDGDTLTFNKEEAYDTGSAIRDNHDCLPRFGIYAYQFNGNLTAEARYLNEMGNMPANYPASPQRDTNLTIYGYEHIPITHDSISFVYDFILKDLDPSHQPENFSVKLNDVWGYVVEANHIQAHLEETSWKDAVTIFPNPSLDEIQIDLGAVYANATIRVLDELGQQIQAVKLTNEQLKTVQLEGAAGFYLIEVEIENRKETYTVSKL